MSIKVDPLAVGVNELHVETCDNLQREFYILNYFVLYLASYYYSHQSLLMSGPSFKT